MSSSTRHLGKLTPASTRILLCDMQQKFMPLISHYPSISSVCQRLMTAGKILSVPRLITEHYPKGLGRTDPAIDTSGGELFEKTLFSMCTPEVLEVLEREEEGGGAGEGVIKSKKREDIVLCGIETQVCIQQTALDLLERGFRVHIPVDAVSSRSMHDRKFALQRMRDAGCFMTTSESLIFMLMKDKNHPKFKEIMPLVKSISPDSQMMDL